VTGASNAEGTGTMYFPAAKYELGGTNAQYYIDSIIAKNVEIYGTGDIHVIHGFESSARGQEVYLAGNPQERHDNGRNATQAVVLFSGKKRRNAMRSNLWCDPRRDEQRGA
jgi:hypothetical protein